MFQNWEFLILEIWMHLLGAVVLTLILSWAIWGLRARSERAEVETLRSDLQKAKRVNEAKDSDLTQAFQKQEQLKERMSGFQTKLSESLAARKELETTAEAEQKKLLEAQKARDALQNEMTRLKKELAMLKAASANPTVGATDQIDGASGGLSLLRERLTTDARRASNWTRKSVSSLLDKVR